MNHIVLSALQMLGFLAGGVAVMVRRYPHQAEQFVLPLALTSLVIGLIAVLAIYGQAGSAMAMR